MRHAALPPPAAPDRTTATPWVIPLPAAGRSIAGVSVSPNLPMHHRRDQLDRPDATPCGARFRWARRDIAVMAQARSTKRRESSASARQEASAAPVQRTGTERSRTDSRCAHLRVVDAGQLRSVAQKAPKRGLSRRRSSGATTQPPYSSGDAAPSLREPMPPAISVAIRPPSRRSRTRSMSAGVVDQALLGVLGRRSAGQDR